MNANDPVVRSVLRRSMVARIATLSSSGRPSVTSLYFIDQRDRIWLGTASWTLAARSVCADPRVSVLFNVERDRGDHRVLRIRGRAVMRTELDIQRIYNRRAARKYLLTPGGIRNALMHIRRLSPMHRYHAQSAEKGPACVIEVIPEQIEFVYTGIVHEA